MDITSLVALVILLAVGVAAWTRPVEPAQSRTTRRVIVEELDDTGHVVRRVSL